MRGPGSTGTSQIEATSAAKHPKTAVAKWGSADHRWSTRSKRLATAALKDIGQAPKTKDHPAPNISSEIEKLWSTIISRTRVTGKEYAVN